MSTTLKHDDAKLPDGWRMVRLGDVLKLEYGISLPERDRQFGDVPVLGSAGVVGFHSKSAVQGPGVVVGRKGSIGSVTWIDDAFVPIDTTYYVTPQKGHADLRWLYYLLDRENLSVLNRATGVPGLNRDDVYALRRPIPPLPEQRAIADALDSIDEAIERTEAVIAATETLRDSLLHELLTRGVPGWHTEWKDVPGIGTIPADWEVVRLGEACDFIRDGDWIESKDQGGSDYRLLQLSNLGVGEFIETDNHRWITQSTFERLHCTEIAIDDVLTARMPDPIGRTWHVTDLASPAVTAVDVAIIRPLKGLLGPKFLANYLNSPDCLRHWNSLATGTTRKRIRRTDIDSLSLPLPPAYEQQAIIDTLDSISRSLEIARSEKHGFEMLKRAAADALLNGRVRIIP